MPVVGLLAEGPTDAMVIEAVVANIRPDVRIIPLLPEMDASGIMAATPNSHGYGWTGVRSYCASIRDGLEEFLRSITSEPLDGLLVHVDCSMAHNVGLQHPCPQAMTTATALSNLVQTTWLQLRGPLSNFIVVTPSMEIEAWVVAALGLQRRSPAPLECDPDITMELVHAKILKMKRDRHGVQAPKKAQRTYVDMKPRIAAGTPAIVSQCTTAAAFAAALARL